MLHDSASHRPSFALEQHDPAILAVAGDRNDDEARRIERLAERVKDRDPVLPGAVGADTDR